MTYWAYKATVVSVALVYWSSIIELLDEGL